MLSALRPACCPAPRLLFFLLMLALLGFPSASSAVAPVPASAVVKGNVLTLTWNTPSPPIVLAPSLQSITVTNAGTVADQGVYSLASGLDSNGGHYLSNGKSGADARQLFSYRGAWNLGSFNNGADYASTPSNLSDPQNSLYFPVDGWVENPGRGLLPVPTFILTGGPNIFGPNQGLIISGLSGGAVTVSNVTTSGTTTTATLSRSVAFTETGGTLSGQAGAFTDSASPPNTCMAFSIPLSNQSTPTPTNLTATGGLTRVNLTWTGIAGSATYSVYRSTVSGAEALLQSGLSATSFADTGLTGGLYYYKVSATLSGSESALSNEASASPSDFTVSANPTALTIVAGGSGTSALTVNPLGGFSGTVSLTGSAALNSTTVSGITVTATAASPGASVSLPISVATSVPPSTYTLTVTGTDATGTVSRKAVINLTVISLVPSNLTAVGGLTRIKLTWTGVAGTPTYSVYRSTSTGTETLLQSGLTTTSFTDSGLAGGATYFYKVTATSSGTESTPSNEASATVTDFTLPTNPATVTVLAGGNATTPVTVTPLGGFGGAVSFSGGASGISVTGTAASPASPATLQVSVTSTAVPGTYNLTVTGTASDATGSVSHTMPLTVVVAPPPVVSIPPGSTWQPNPALVGQTITSTVSTSVANPYQAPNGDSVTQTWTWTTGTVYMSAAGAPGSFSAAGNYSISWSPGSPTSQFSGSFINPGYYIVGVTASLTYYDNTTGQSFGPYSGSGYIGGSASDLVLPKQIPLSGSAASLPLSTSGSRAVQPQATGTTTVDGIAVTALTIMPTGTTPDSNQNPNILVGQQCTARVVGIPAALQPYAAYSWAPSGTTFESWSPTSPTNSQASSLVGVIPATNPTQWCWNDPNPAAETIKCTVTITPPAGQGSPFSQTVTAPKPVSVQFPQWTATGIGGYMQMNNFDPATGLDYSLYAGPTGTMYNNNQLGGMNFKATSITPPLFGTGSLELVQLVTPSLSYTNKAYPPVVHTDPEQTQGLDIHYPKSSNGSSGEGSTPYQANDVPGIDLTAYDAGSATEKHHFVDYLLYKPPGANSQWITLAQFNWSVNGSATLPATGNWADYVMQNGSDTVGTVTPNTTTPFTSVYGPDFFVSWTKINIFPQTF